MRNFLPAPACRLKLRIMQFLRVIGSETATFVQITKNQNVVFKENLGAVKEKKVVVWRAHGINNQISNALMTFLIYHGTGPITRIGWNPSYIGHYNLVVSCLQWQNLFYNFRGSSLKPYSRLRWVVLVVRLLRKTTQNFCRAPTIYILGINFAPIIDF